MASKDSKIPFIPTGPGPQISSKVVCDCQGFPMISFGQVGAFGKEVAAEVEKAVAVYKTVEGLMNIADSFREFPTSEILNLLVDSIKHGGGGVAETFFGKSTVNAFWGGQNFTSDRDELAVALLSDDLSRVKTCSFGSTTDSSKANELWKNLIKSQRGVAMGNGLLLQILIKDHGFQSYLNDKSNWEPKLKTLLTNKAYILGTIVKQLTMQSGLPAKMKMFIFKALGGDVKSVLAEWETVSGDKNIAQQVLEFLDSYNNLTFAVESLDADKFVNDASSACNKSSTHSWSTMSPDPPLPNVISIVSEHTETTYGSSVSSWLSSSNGPRRYGLRTGSSPDNIRSSTHVDGPFGCFVAGTQVLLQSGNVTIEHLHEHDHVVGANGITGIVSSEEVSRLLDKDMPVYGFNDEAPFFLASHPFWTQHGWRAVSPHSAKTSNTWLEVGQLTEGDFVRRLKNYKNGSTEYEWVEVKSIHFQDLSAGNRVYGIHTREGPRSYHANGYLVLQNFPEITTKRICDGMNNISATEQQHMHDKLKEVAPILHKVMGPGPANAMLKLAKSYHENLHKPAQLMKAAKVHLRELSLPHIKLTRQAGKTSHESYDMPEKLALVRGHLFVDDDHVTDVHLTDDDKVCWTRPVAGGKWEHGSLKLYPDRQKGHAVMSVTQAREDSRSLVSATFAATSHVSTYTCSKSKAPIKKDTDKGTSYVPFGGLKMGLETEDGHLSRVGQIMTPDMEGEYDSLDHHITFSVDSKFQLKVEVIVPTDYQELLKHTGFYGTFSWDYSTFSGYCIEYDPLKPGNEGDHYAWKGVLDTANMANVASMHAVARSQALNHGHHDQIGSTFSACAPTTQLMSLQAAPAAPMRSTMMLMADNELTLEHLFTLTPPDPKSVHDLTFSLLQKAMKYEMGDDDRSNILGVVKPTDLSGDMITAADKYKDFFKDRFANAYLMNGLAQSEHFEDKITDEQRNKLLYYWAGQDEGCLGKDTDYNAVNNEVARVAFVQSCPDVQKYMDSSQGGEYWAKQLFDKLTTPAVLNGLALTQDVGNSSPIIQKQTMVMYCLAPNKDYGTTFYKKIMVTRMNETSSKFMGNKNDKAVMKEFITDYIRQLINQILAGGDATTAELMKELGKQLQDAAKELNVEITDDAIQTVKDMMEHMDSAIDFAITWFNNSTGTMLSRITGSMKNWMENHPKLVKLGGFLSTAFTMAAWGMSLVYTIRTFMNWKTLEPQQKAQLVIETVAFTLKSIAKVPDVIESIKGACSKGKAGFKFVKNWMKVSKDESVVDGIEETIEAEVESIEGEGVSAEQAMAEAAAATGEDVAESVSNWQRFFSITETFAKITGVLALAAGCVAIGFQIYNDFKSGAPVAQKVLDILQGVTMGIATVAAAVGLFVEAACIPVIGIVCAVVGIILTIVGLFIHRDPPKPKPTKIDLYVQGTGSKFMNGLPSPSQEWLDNYHKTHDKDKK